jgi:serine/threonine protein kinase/Tfp pilus assembly protein PilF
MQEDSIFFEALEVGDPASRAELLARACGADATLRRRVEGLLEHHSRAGGFLETPPVGPALAAGDGRPLTEGPGTTIGPFELVEQIGEGGMGVVFLARQTSPVERDVALKIVKPGMDSRQVIARFEAERQALARMDHPNIAKVLDAGTTRGSGRPYFVMELVQGVPITRYCDEHRLAPAARLELFVQVCNAIQHAHTKGIIHRDLKPSNVLVPLYDGTPVPKVIDFGVAKATGQQWVAERTMFTSLGSVVGTPEYMSPEQAELNPIDIDTRSDIYALGVLLYELLTGTTPLDRRRRFKDAAVFELLRVVREEEPTRPSTRVYAAARELPDVAADRGGMEPGRLSALVRGELDWIVMKALEKDRNRRYETAAALASDVRRYLANEPVQACPPSAGYRFRKWAQRNKGTFVAVSAVTVLLLVTLVTLAVSNAMIRNEQGRTHGEKVRAQAAQKLAEVRAEQVRDGLERLKLANVMIDRGRWFVERRQWDDANAAFTRAIALRPDHVSVWVERADLYTRLGLWDVAAADFAREMELRGPDTAGRWHQHALLRLASGDVAGYRDVCRRMRERFAGTLKAQFVEAVLRSCVLSAEGVAGAGAGTIEPARLVEQARQLATSYPTTSTLRVLGAAHLRAGQFDEASRRLREALERDANRPERVLALPLLAIACQRQGKMDEARAALERAGAVIEQWTRDRYQGQGDYWVIDLGAKAVWPLAWWDWLEYQLLYREARSAISGTPAGALADDPRLHVLRGRALAGLRWPERAVAEYERAMAAGLRDPQVAMEAHRNRGYVFVHAGKWAQAAEQFDLASAQRPEDVFMWRFRAVAHFLAGNDEAYRRTCSQMLEAFGRVDDALVACNVLQACTMREGAVADPSRLVELTQVTDRIWHFGTWTSGAALYRAGWYEESIECFESAQKWYRPRAWDWSFLAMSHARLGHGAEARRCLAEAAKWIDEANHAEGYELDDIKPAWGDWNEPAVYPLIYREAKGVVDSAAAREGEALAEPR